MKYFRIDYESAYCGTQNTDYHCQEGELTPDQEQEIWEDKTQDLFEMFGYLINGWAEDDPTEEEEEEFKADCSVEITEITKEEWEEGVGYNEQVVYPRNRLSRLWQCNL